MGGSEMNEDGGQEARDDASRTRARWLGVLLIVVALGAVTFEAWELGDGLPPEEVARTHEWGKLPSLAEMLGSVQSRRNEPEAPTTTASAVPVVVAASPAPLGPGEAEVCGFGRVKLGTPEAEDLTRRIDASTKSQRDRVKQALLASADEGERAVGLYLQGVSVGNVWAVHESASDAERAQQDSMDRDAIDTLARMAVASRSAQVYALALRACDVRKSGGTCQMLSTEQWTRLDPGNAAPWMRALDDARRRRDAGGAAEAVHRIGQSTRVDTYADSILKAAARYIEKDLTLSMRYLTFAEYVGQTAMTDLSYQGLIEHCSAVAVRDGNRLQSCAAVADALVGKGSSSVVAVSAGMAIGERTGWSVQRVQAFKDERESVNLAIEDHRDMTCRSAIKQTRIFEDWATMGERRALQEQVKQLPAEQVATARGRWEAREAARAASAPVAN